MPETDRVDHDPRVVDEQHRAADGRLHVVVLRRPEVVPVEVHRREARADVEVHRQSRSRTPPTAGPRPGWPGRASPRSCGSEVMFTPRRPSPAARSGLADARLDIPGRQEGHRQEAVAGLVLHLGHGVVVDLDAQQAQRRRPSRLQAPGRRGRSSWGTAPGRGCRTRRCISSRALVSQADVIGPRCPTRSSTRGTGTCCPRGRYAASAREAEPVRAVLHHPGVPAVDLLDPGNAVLVGGGRAAGPQVVLSRSGGCRSR